MQSCSAVKTAEYQLSNDVTDNDIILFLQIDPVYFVKKVYCLNFRTVSDG